jgi:hypothetical protein
LMDVTDELEEHRYRGVDWKQDLRFSRGELDSHLAVGEGDRSLCIAVERFVMRSALALRKLLDRRVLSDEVLNSSWPLRRCECVTRPDPRFWFDGTVDLVNYHHVARYYAIDRPESEEISLKHLSNQLLHSFAFVVWLRPGDVVPADTRFFFNSDDSKSKWLYEMTVGEFECVVDAVVTDAVVWVDINKESGRFRQHNAAWRAANWPPR